ALPSRPAELEWTLARTDREDPTTQQQGSALLTVTARDEDPKVVGRAFSGAVVQIALGSVPGFHTTTPPTSGSPYGVFTPGYVDQGEPVHEVVLDDGTVEVIAPPRTTRALEPLTGEAPSEAPSSHPGERSGPGATVRAPLGTIAGARSGDKGGSANIGVWVRHEAGPEGHAWLLDLLTVARVRELLPETADLPITITSLPNLRAVNIVIEGLLGEGVAYNARFDPHAKGLAEWLRSRHIDMPAAVADSATTAVEESAP